MIEGNKQISDDLSDTAAQAEQDMLQRLFDIEDNMRPDKGMEAHYQDFIDNAKSGKQNYAFSLLGFIRDIVAGEIGPSPVLAAYLQNAISKAHEGRDVNDVLYLTRAANRKRENPRNIYICVKSEVLRKRGEKRARADRIIADEFGIKPGTIKQIRSNKLNIEAAAEWLAGVESVAHGNYDCERVDRSLRWLKETFAEG